MNLGCLVGQFSHSMLLHQGSLQVGNFLPNNQNNVKHPFGVGFVGKNISVRIGLCRSLVGKEGMKHTIDRIQAKMLINPQNYLV